jgi:hypothetical protein
MFNNAFEDVAVFKVSVKDQKVNIALKLKFDECLLSFGSESRVLLFAV